MVDDLTPDEREHLRSAWESLEPDDALVGIVLEGIVLESIVVDAARDVPPAQRRRIPLWLPAVSLAAAMLLLAVFSRRAPEPVPTGQVPNVPVPVGDGDDEEPLLTDVTNAPTIWSPPSVAHAEKARARNTAITSGLQTVHIGRYVSYRAAGLSGVIHGSSSENMPAQSEDGGLHRFVSRDDWRVAENKIYESTTPRPDMRPPPACVGMEFIKAHPSLFTLVQDVTVEIRTPESTPATTRLSLRVDRGFSGWAIVPNDVARALGLTQFEIPGNTGVRYGAEIAHGYRARAVLALPHDVGPLADGVEVEVFVPRAQRPQLASIAMAGDEEAKPKQVVSVFGLPAPYISMTQGISYKAEDGAHFHGRTGLKKPTDDERKHRRIDVPIQFETPVSLHLDWDDGRALWVPAIDLGDDWGSQTSITPVSIEWRADPIQCPAGSTFIASTVWRGTRASVAPAGIAFGVVGEAGQFDAMLLKGHDLNGLRAYVKRPDGTNVWVDAPVNKNRISDFRKLGTPERPVLSARNSFCRLEGIPSPQLAMDPTDPVGNAEKLTRLLAVLTQRLWEGKLEEAPIREVGLLFDESTPWTVAESLLRTGATYGVSSYAMQRAPVSRSTQSRVEWLRIPTDEGLKAKTKDEPTLSLAISVGASGTLVEWSGAKPGSFQGSGMPWVTDELLGQWRALNESTPNLTFVISVSDSLNVPVAVVHDLLRAFREAEITRYVFRATPKTGK